MNIFLVIMGHFGNAISGLRRLTLVDENQGLADAYLCPNTRDGFGECERISLIKFLVDLLIAYFAAAELWMLPIHIL